MQNNLEIKNFKSIKFFQQACTRINIFIGEPNTGKSNILEALGLLSYTQFSEYGGLEEFIRYNRTTNLFYDDFIDDPFMIKLGPLSLKIQFKSGTFSGEALNQGQNICTMQGDYKNIKVAGRGNANKNPPLVKYYKFIVLDRFNRPESEYLLPPHGNNLVSLLLTNPELRSTFNNIINRYGLKIALKPHEDLIEIMKEVQGVIISYPYVLASDTMQRVIFHLCAVLSNKDSVLIFEEPESHAFPYYTKYLAELMALDDNNNQYFIATHNPYFLEPIIEKSPKEDITVFITYFEDYQTKVKPLDQNETENLLQIDAFSNIDKFIKMK